MGCDIRGWWIGPSAIGRGATDGMDCESFCEVRSTCQSCMKSRLHVAWSVSRGQSSGLVRRSIGRLSVGRNGSSDGGGVASLVRRLIDRWVGRSVGRLRSVLMPRPSDGMHVECTCTEKILETSIGP